MKIYTDSEIIANRKTFIHALRSGEFKKGVGTLRTGKDKYCALGVGWTVSGLTTWEVKGPFFNRKYIPYTTSSQHDNLENWLGIVPGAVTLGTLIRMNDDEGKTFKEISNYLEELWF